MESQNLTLLQSVDKPTKSQVILQHTVEGLSVIVIAYYLAGLAGYVFKGLSEVGWLQNANIASAIFVPIAIGLALCHYHNQQEVPAQQADRRAACAEGGQVRRVGGRLRMAARVAGRATIGNLH